MIHILEPYENKIDPHGSYHARIIREHGGPDSSAFRCAAARYQSSQIGYGWQRCHCGGGQENEPAQALSLYPVADHPVGRHAAVPGRRHHLRRSRDRLFLPGRLADQGFRRFAWKGCWTWSSRPLQGRAAVELCIRPATATAGDSKHVHMVIDFGNSRTGALLVELAGEISQTPQMLPFELVTAITSTPGTTTAKWSTCPAARWFSSKTHWCNTPYLSPLPQKQIEYHNVGDDDCRGGWFGRGKKPRQNKVEVVVTPPLFDDLSMVRLGREADDVVQVMRAEGDIRTGAELAQALSLGRRRQLAGRGQLVHGRSGRPLPHRRLCRHAQGAVPPLHPRGRPRLPPGASRVRRRASSPPRRR